MGSFKQQCLTWIIISATAVCVSCQGLITSTLREGNRTCPGKEVIFNCTLRGSSILAWISPGYIEDGNPLQFSARSMLSEDVLSMINGRVTATATLTNIVDDNGVLVLESMLRITAVQASVVTCSGTSGDTDSIEFSISAVPGVPQRIDAAEISRPRDNICIILVTWDPPANSNGSDIGQYIVYVPSQNTSNIIPPSSLTTLTVPNCGDDIRVQVAAVNRVGCVGMNSSEVQPILLDIPAVLTEDGSFTTEDDSATVTAVDSTSSQLGAGAIAGIAIGSAACAIVITCCLFCIFLCFLEKFLDCCDACLSSCDACLAKRKSRKPRGVIRHADPHTCIKKPPTGDEYAMVDKKKRPPLDSEEDSEFLGHVYLDPIKIQHGERLVGDLYALPTRKKHSENVSSEQYNVLTYAQLDIEDPQPVVYATLN